MTKCLKDSAFSVEEQKYITNQAAELVAEGMSQKEAEIAVITKLKETLNSSLKDIYTQLGISTQRTTKVVSKPNKQSITQFISQINKNPESLNNTTKEQRDNAIIDISRELWSHPSSTEQIENYSNFDELRKLREEIKERLGIHDENANPIFPRSDAAFFERSTIGSTLLPIAALNKPIHALLQYTNVEFKNDFMFDGEKSRQLNHIKSLKGDELVSSNFEEFLAAMADNDKDPIAGYLNLNEFTVNTYLSILHTGFPTDTAIYFINQPIIRRLFKGYQKFGETLAGELEAIKMLKGLLVSKIGEDIPYNIYMLRTSDLKNGANAQILEDMSKETAKDQLKVLYTFLKYKELAQSLSNLTIAAQADKAGTGKTMSENHFKLHRLDKVREDKNLVNQADLLDKVPLIQVSTEYGVIKPQNELLAKYLPFNGQLFTNITDVATLQKGQNLTSKEIKYLYTQFIHWYVSGFDFFKASEKSRYINAFPEYFNKLKADNSLNKFELIRYLRFVPISEKNKVARVEFTSGATVSDEQRELIRQSWEAMLASDDTKISKLAKELIQYAFHTTNFGFTYSGFSHLIPPTYLENITNSDGFTYRDYLYKLMDERNNGTLVYPFLEEVYQNNEQKGSERLVRKVTGKQITNKGTTKKSITPSLMFTSEKAEDLGLYNDESKDTIDYIRYKNNNGLTYTYKFAGHTKDANLVYNIIPNKGYENHIVEFSKNAQRDSVLTINNLPQFEEKDYFNNLVKDDNELAQLIKEREEGTYKVDQQLTSILSQFAASLGIEFRYLSDVKTRTGVSVRGLADIFNRIILISTSKEKPNTLPEEVGHFAEAFMRHDPIHKTLMGMITQTETYKQVLADYGELYKDNPDKIKQEAIGQLIGEAIIKRNAERRAKSNNALLQFLEALWNKFLNIFKRANPTALITDINSITDYIADQVLDQNIDTFKAPSNIKIGEKFYQLGDDEDLNTTEKAIESAIESIYKKIKIYSEKGSEQYARTEQNLLERLRGDFASKSFELGLIRYVANARIELKNVAKRYNNIKVSTPTTVEEKRELLNQLKAAKNYVNGFRDTLQDIAKLAPFSKEINAKIAQTAVLTESLNDSYLHLGKALIVDTLKTFSTHPSLDIKKALDILDGDISWFQRWFDSMAETSDPILGILDKILKDSKEVGRRKELDLAKTMIDAQKKLEQSNIKSTSFYAERDFAGNLTGNRIQEYNYGEYAKQKSKFFLENPKPLRESFPSNVAHVEAVKSWGIKVAQWFNDNTQPNPDREEIIKSKKEEFNKEYPNSKVATEKYNEWLASSIKEVYGVDETGPIIETVYRGDLQIPSEKYRSEQWKDVQANPAMKEYVDTVTEILDSLDKLLPEKYKLKNKLPQVRKDFYERLYFVDQDGKKKLKAPLEIAKEARTTIAEAFTRNENDIEFGLTDENNLPINFVPVYWTKRLENMNNLSTDITSTVTAFGSTVHDFNAMSQVLGTLEVAKDILAERAVLTGKFDPVTLMSKLTKKNKEGEDIKVKAISIKGDKSLSYARLEDYLQMVVFGHQKEPGLIVKGIDVAKVLDQINRYTALNSLAGNIYSGISNVTFGTALERTEAIANEFYGNKELLVADKIYSWELINGGTLGDIGQRQASSTLNLWEEIHNTLQNYSREFKDIEAGRTTLFSRLMKESSLYFLNHSGEHYMQLRSSIALAHRVQVKTKEGEVIPYWKAYDKVNVGTKELPSYRLKLKEGLTKVGSDKHGSLFRQNEDGKPLTDEDIRRFINRQNFLNKRLHGIYNNVDISAIQKKALGRIGLMFRKYVKPGWNRRYAKLTYNEEGEIWTEGNYNTMYRFMGGLFKDLAKLKFSFIKNYKELNDGEKANVQRTLVEVAYMIGAIVVAAALTQMADDDDDNAWISLAAYEAYRLYSELRFYSSITEAQRLLRSPAAAIYQFDNLARFAQVWNWGEEYQSGRYKGLTHFERGLIDIVPFAGTYTKFRTPEEQLKFYTNNGVTIF